MLTASKTAKMLKALKTYHRTYLKHTTDELDESGTRLIINSFLTDVLGYRPITEIKTEYMIRGTYADYVIQLKGVRHFLVEVKALSYDLADKHLRQAINYGANEGIEWALLTNGRRFDFYRILFNKPIEGRRVFSLDLGDSTKHKAAMDSLQFLHRESVDKKGLLRLWQKTAALDPKNLAGLLIAKPVVSFIKRTLIRKHRNKFTEQEIVRAINHVVCEAVDTTGVKAARVKRSKRSTRKGKVSVAMPPAPSSTTHSSSS